MFHIISVVSGRILLNHYRSFSSTEKLNFKQEYMKRSINIVSFLVLILTALPIIYLINIAVKYSVDIPSYDEWFFVPLFEKMFNGTLTLQDLWAQTNEHRLVVTKLLMLMFVKFTGWNLKYQIAFNIILCIGILTAFIYFLKRESKWFRHYLPTYLPTYLIIPNLSFMIFSLGQFENLLWGLQMLVFINVLAVVVGFILLTESSMSWKSISLSVFTGIIALYNYAGGLLYWPIGLALIFFQPRLAKVKKIKFIIFWILSTIAILLTYFYNYTRPAYEPPIPITYPLQHFAESIKLMLQILGSPLEMMNPNFSMILGLSGLIIFIILFMKFRNVKKNNSLVLFLLAIGFYGFTNAILTGAGRIGFGLNQRLISRYSTTPELFWLSITILLFLYLNSARKTIISSKLKMFAICLLVVITCLSVRSSYQGTRIAKSRSNLLQEVRKNFLQADPANGIKIIMAIYPRTNVNGHTGAINLSDLARDLYTLSKYKLTFFKSIN